MSINTRDMVRQFIVENFLGGEDPENFTAETELQESGILTSIALLKLVVFLEQQFGVEVETKDVEAGDLATVEKIEQLVNSRRK